MRALAAFVLLFCSANAAAADISGLWTGVYIGIGNRCGGGVSHGGPVTLNLSQTGSAVTGRFIVRGHLADSPCATSVFSQFEQGLMIGSVSGDSVSLFFGNPGEPGTTAATGTVIGDEMTLDATDSDPGEFGKIHLTRSTRTESFAGRWSGPFRATDTGCVPPRLQTGTFTLTVNQTGSLLSGELVAQPATESCFPDNAPMTVAFEATVSGRRFATPITVESDPGFLYGFVRDGIVSIAFVVEEPAGTIGTAVLTPSAAPDAPVITGFTVSPSTVLLGSASRLEWITKDATSVSISGGVGVVPGSGSVTVRPATTTTYTLTAANPHGTRTATATIVVTPTAAEVAVSARPRGMLQQAGGAFATDSYTLTNVGGTSTTVTLAQSGSFFTQTPPTFTLAGGATQVVTITSATQQANTFDGTSTVAGVGVPQGLSVPVRLLVSAPPVGTVQPRPSQTRLTVPVAGSSPTVRAVAFTNDGNSTLQAIVISDAPWIEPQQGIVTISPGATAQVSFTVLPANRPDAGSATGGVEGSLSLRFLTTSTNGLKGIEENATTVATISVSIVSVVTPATGGETPGPLAGSEVAMFISGLGSQPVSSGDLFLSFPGGGASIPSLKIYQAPAGSVTFKSNSLVSVATTPPLSFPQIAGSVFSSASPVNSVQLRSAEIHRIAVAANRVNTSGSLGTYGTALPIFRSDRAVQPGGGLVLSGLLKATGFRTDLYVQELSGNAGAIRLDFFNAAGGNVETRASVAIRGYELLEFADAVPASAVALRVISLGSGQARIAAYAVVVAASTGDAWVSLDTVVMSGTLPDTYYIPIVTPGAGAETTLHATSRSNSPTPITFDVVSAAPKRRTTRIASASTGGSAALRTEPLSTYLLPPRATVTFNVAPVSSGYLRIRSNPGAVSVAGRSIVTASNDRPVPYGDGLPVIPADEALSLGQSLRFTAVDDTEVFRSNLLLIETAGKSVIVRVSLTYSFAAASKATAFATSTRDYSLPASGFLQVSDVVRSVIGSARDAFGNLHGIQMDVEVVSGDGGAIPSLVTVDGRTGDLVVRRQ